MSIPKKAHFMWLSKSGEDVIIKDLKQSYRKNMNDFAQLNPDYQEYLWTNVKIERLFELPVFQKYKQFFHEMQPHICKCDFVRYMIMYLKGGVYFDLDFKFIKPMPDLSEYKLAFSHEPPNMSNHEYPNIFNLTGGTSYISSGILFSEPGNQFWLNLLDQIVLKYETFGPPIGIMNVVATTGPKMLSEQVELHLEKDSNINTVHIFSDFTLFFGGSSLSVSINDWQDGTHWPFDNIFSMNWWKEIKIFLIFVILMVIISFMVVIFLTFNNSRKNKKLRQFKNSVKILTNRNDYP